MLLSLRNSSPHLWSYLTFYSLLYVLTCQYFFNPSASSFFSYLSIHVSIKKFGIVASQRTGFSYYFSQMNSFLWLWLIRILTNEPFLFSLNPLVDKKITRTISDVPWNLTLLEDKHYIKGNSRGAYIYEQHLQKEPICTMEQQVIPR